MYSEMKYFRSVRPIKPALIWNSILQGLQFILNHNDNLMTEQISVINHVDSGSIAARIADNLEHPSSSRWNMHNQ